jgi:hypothetical protein
MTFGEYVAWSVGQYKKEIERWQRTRVLAYTSASAMGGMSKSEAEFMPLPFDEVPIDDLKISKEVQEQYITKFRQAHDS